MSEQIVDSAKMAALGLLANMRSWNEEFYAPDGFKVPETQDQYVPRMQANLGYYASNYALICLVFLIICLVVSPGALMVGFLIVALWAVLLTRPEDFEIAGQSLAKLKVILGFLSCALILIFGDVQAFVILGFEQSPCVLQSCNIHFAYWKFEAVQNKKC